MNIYQKNLRRLGLLLIIVSILDVILELTFYRYLQSAELTFIEQLQSPLGICIKDGIGLLGGCLACLLYGRREHASWIVRALAALLAVEIPVILFSSKGNSSRLR